MAEAYYTNLEITDKMTFTDDQTTVIGVFGIDGTTENNQSSHEGGYWRPMELREHGDMPGICCPVLYSECHEDEYFCSQVLSVINEQFEESVREKITVKRRGKPDKDYFLEHYVMPDVKMQRLLFRIPGTQGQHKVPQWQC